MGRWFVALALACLVFCFAGGAAAAPWTIEPAPSWVTPSEGDERPSASTGGLRYLLFDLQTRVGTDLEGYAHFTEELTNETGLTAASQLKITFDPTFERVAFHWVRIRRGTETLDRLVPSAIQVVQREPNLEAQTLDGTRTAVLFLADLRVGDVVDVAYTIRGADPTLGGHFAATFDFGASAPIGRIRNRVVLTGGRTVHVLGHSPDGNRSALAVTPVVHGDVTEYEWSFKDVPAAATDTNVPSWYRDVRWVQLTDFSTWSEIAKWATRLFAVAPPTEGPLLAWVRSTRAASSTNEEFLRGAIRFVQDDVRYVAIEVGLARRVPTPADTVFARRYGDCKDKTALLVAMLRAAGIDAAPVLVSTGLGHVLEELEPTPTVFDHAIVRARLGDRRGKSEVYWIDGTTELQGGGLERHRGSPFERALVVADETTDLEPLPVPDAQVPQLSVYEQFKVADPAANGDTSLYVERTYSAYEGDSTRAQLKARAKDEVGKFYLALYEDDFPQIREAEPFVVTDDRDADALKLAFHYVIPKVWTFGADGVASMQVRARVIERALARPPNAPRTTPWAVDFPAHVMQRIDLDLPFEIPMTPTHTNVVDPAFDVQFASTYEPKTHRVGYTYELVTRARSVAAADIDGHRAHLDDVTTMAGRAITFRPPTPDGMNWSALAMLLGLCPFIIWGGVRAYRWDPKRPKPALPPDPKLAGFGGWLVLLALNVAVAPLARLRDLVKCFAPLLSQARWHALTTAGIPSYSPGLAVLVVVETLFVFASLVYGVVVAIVMFKKLRTFPTHFTIMAVSMALFSIIDNVSVSFVTESVTDDVGAGLPAAVRLIVFAAIWVTYVHNSKRVSATFVERRARKRKRS